MKKSNVRILATSLGFLLIATTSIKAQNVEQPKHEFSVQGGFGLSTLKAKMNVGDNSNKIGGTFGFGYSYYINDNFSLLTGLDIAFYNSKTTLDGFTNQYKTMDSSGEEFDLKYTVNGYSEKQNSTYLQIPLMGQYQLPVFGTNKLYFALGFKLGLPVSGKYETAGSKFTTKGLYAYGVGGAPVEVENMPLQGFGTYTSGKVKEDLKPKVSFMLSVETGMKWTLPSSMSLYTGLYVDYGLNNVAKNKSDKRFLVYDSTNPQNYTYNSITSAEYTNGSGKDKIVDKLNPLAVGLKLRLSFNLLGL